MTDCAEQSRATGEHVQQVGPRVGRVVKVNGFDGQQQRDVEVVRIECQAGRVPGVGGGGRSVGALGLAHRDQPGGDGGAEEYDDTCDHDARSSIEAGPVPRTVLGAASLGLG
jgi:hypothetical protein